MAKIVTALACTHNPYVIWGKYPKKQLNEVFNPIRKKLKESDADVLLVIANDHINNFFLDNMPAFAIGIAPRAEGPFIQERMSGLPTFKSKVNEVVARDLLTKGIHLGVDFASAQHFTLDHGFTMPLHLSLSNIKIPIVPIFTNALVQPLPRTKRFFKVGQILKKIIDSRPKAEKVAVLSSFNYSVEVGGHKMGTHDREFDEKAEQYLLDGKVDQILNEFTIERLIDAGNSTGEFLNYVTLLGMIGNRKPSYYRNFNPHPESFGKDPIVAWDLE